MAPMAQVLAVLFLVSCAAMTTGQNPDIKPYNDAPACPSDHFSCYKDCCLRGQMFCNHRSMTCYHCDTRKVLCGNDSLPVECLLYCHLLKHPFDTDAEYKISFDRVTFIAGTAAVFILIGVAVVGLCFLVWKPVNALPVCIRKILRARDKECSRPSDGQKDVDDGETNTHELHESSNPKKPLLCRSSSKSPSRTPSMASSDKSQPPLDVSELNVSPVNSDFDGETQPATSPQAQGPTRGDVSTPIGPAPTNTVAQPNGLSGSANGRDKNIGEGLTRNPLPGSETRPGARCPPSAGQGARCHYGESTSEASAPMPSPVQRHVIVADVVVSRPDFSSITPTIDPTNPTGKVVIATGTKNPAENCCTEAAHVQSFSET